MLEKGMIKKMTETEKDGGDSPGSPGCVRCGQCMSVCPVYGATLREADVARGRLALLRWAKDHGESPVEVPGDALYRCLLCGACSDVCAARVDTVGEFIGARRRKFAEGGASLKARLELAALTRGDLAGEILRKGGRLAAALVSGRIADTSGLFLRFPASVLAGRDVIPALAARSFLDSPPVGAVFSPDAKNVGFFVGCGANHIFTDASFALSRLGGLTGHNILAPRTQGCCGLPALASGDYETARLLARQNVEAFSGMDIKALLTVCASCGHQVLSWPDLIGPDDPLYGKALELARLHRDALRFLHSETDIAARLSATKGPQLRVHYHAPCHLRFGAGADDSPRRLLAGMPSIELVSEGVPASCCGHGGSFNAKHHDLSMEIFEPYGKKVMDAAPDFVVTGCTGCLLQFTEGVYRLKRAGKTGVLHPLVLLERLLGPS
ncbi:MAG: (Fe-S)-binding protein [Deltaproteobacteria bacterium]|nr:(Fe-S)-binding protein [Deltaproteobacteria bacterium]